MESNTNYEGLISRFLTEYPELINISRIEYDSQLKELFVYRRGNNRGYSIYEQEISYHEWSKLLELEDIIYLYRISLLKLLAINRSISEEEFLNWFGTPNQKFAGLRPIDLVRSGRVSEILDLFRRN